MKRFGKFLKEALIGLCLLVIWIVMIVLGIVATAVVMFILGMITSPALLPLLYMVKYIFGG